MIQTWLCQLSFAVSTHKQPFTKIYLRFPIITLITTAKNCDNEEQESNRGSVASICYFYPLRFIDLMCYNI